MAVVALPVLATALVTQRYDEVTSLVELELNALRPHSPAGGHPYSSLLQATLADFKSMEHHELHSWAVSLAAPLEEARREGDEMWEWVIVSELRAICRRFLAGDRAMRVPCGRPA